MSKYTHKEYRQTRIVCNRFKPGVGAIRCYYPIRMMGATGATGAPEQPN